MARAYLTLEQVSERIHISPGTARNRLSRGEPMPPSVKVGRRRLFPEDAFEHWMLERHSPHLLPEVLSVYLRHLEGVDE